jgi:hypothetical protein
MEFGLFPEDYMEQPETKQSKLSVENLNTKLRSDNVVWVSNKSGHDFSDAKRYGPLQFVTLGQVNRFSVGYMARMWMRSLISSKKEDYILLTSLTILTVVGAAIFGWMHGRVNILIFRNNKYICRSILFDQLLEAEKEALQNEQSNQH